jgi:hypothetical protein
MRNYEYTKAYGSKANIPQNGKFVNSFQISTCKLFMTFIQLSQAQINPLAVGF